jgi:uncharacterized protein YbjQ (UPF0145 family)
MLFFRKKDDADETDREQRARNRQAQLDALTRGEIMPDALKRLKEGIATTDFSTAEFLLARDRGCESLGVVMGSAFYSARFGALYTRSWNQRSGELTDLSHALYEARRLALMRLRQEASALGAHGVIGVRLQFKTHDWSTHHIEFTAIGTAVRIAGFPDVAQPFTCDLSAQEFWQLYQAGYLPKELVLGVCAFYVACDYDTARIVRGGVWGQGGRNQEITQYAQGFNHTRRLAVERLDEDIRRAGGEGAVGMEIDYDFEEREYERNKVEYIDLVITFTAIGTAIVRYKAPPHHDAIRPLLCYDLASGKTTPL